MIPATGSGREDPRFAFLDGIRELPSLPQILVGVSKIASDPSSSASDLADIIRKDQAITLKVLRIANSARYAVCAQRISTVSRAVVLLGFESVRAIALGVGAYHLLSALKRGGGILERFWTHAIATAVVCQDLALLLGSLVAEEAFVAGLLHDVGKLVLAEHCREAARSLYLGHEGGAGLLLAETQTFGVNRAEVGEELARRWDLPDLLRKAIANHHRPYSAPPSETGDRLAFLVGVGKTLVHALWEDTGDPKELATKMARVLRKPVGPLLATLEGIPERIREFAKFFEIRLGDLETYTLWVEGENQRLHEAFERQEADRRRVERRRAEMGVIRETHGMLLAGAGAEAVAGRVLRAVRESVGARRALLGRVVGLPSTVRADWGQGDLPPDFVEAFRFPLVEGGMVAEAVGSGAAVNVFDTRLPYFQRLLSPRETRVLDAPSFAVVPIVVAGGTVGILYADRQEGDDAFSDDEVDTLRTLADLVGLATRFG